MPYRLTWEAGPTGVVVEYSGRISANDVSAVFEEITVDSRWAGLRYVIVDASHIDGVDIDTSSRVTLAEPNILLIGAASVHEPLLFACVTRNAEMLHVLQRQQELGVFPYPTSVFDSVMAARQWVGQRLDR